MSLSKATVTPRAISVGPTAAVLVPAASASLPPRRESQQIHLRSSFLFASILYLRRRLNQRPADAILELPGSSLEPPSPSV